MTQLGEEWRRRETQRQQLLRQKLEHYTSLEKQLQEGLDKLQTQQNLLQERERKVCVNIVDPLHVLEYSTANNYNHMTNLVQYIYPHREE